jgi:hypothetical protein
MKKESRSDQVRRLGPEISPSRDLWPRIESVIRSGHVVAKAPELGQPVFGTTRWLVAAAALLVVGAGILIPVLRLDGDGEIDPEAQAVAQLVEQANVAYDEYKAARACLLDAIGELDRRYGQSLSDELTAQFDPIDARIETAMAELSERPDTATAGALLAMVDYQILAVSQAELLLDQTRIEEQRQ